MPRLDFSDKRSAIKVTQVNTQLTGQRLLGLDVILPVVVGANSSIKRVRGCHLCGSSIEHGISHFKLVGAKPPHLSGVKFRGGNRSINICNSCSKLSLEVIGYLIGAPFKDKLPKSTAVQVLNVMLTRIINNNITELKRTKCLTVKAIKSKLSCISITPDCVQSSTEELGGVINGLPKLSALTRITAKKVGRLEVFFGDLNGVPVVKRSYEFSILSAYYPTTRIYSISAYKKLPLTKVLQGYF